MPFNLDAAHVDVVIRYRHSVPICSLAAIAGVDIARSRELARGSLATARPRRRAAVPRALSDAAPGRGERFLRHGRSAVRPLVESFADDGRAALPPDAPAGVRMSERGSVRGDRRITGDGDDGVLWSAQLDVAGVGGGRLADRVDARQLQRADVVAEMGRQGVRVAGVIRVRPVRPFGPLV